MSRTVIFICVLSYIYCKTHALHTCSTSPFRIPHAKSRCEIVNARTLCFFSSRLCAPCAPCKVLLQGTLRTYVVGDVLFARSCAPWSVAAALYQNRQGFLALAARPYVPSAYSNFERAVPLQTQGASTISSTLNGPLALLEHRTQELRDRVH